MPFVIVHRLPNPVWPSIAAVLLLMSAADIARAQSAGKKAASTVESTPPAESEDPVPEAPAEDETEDLITIDKMELPSFARLMQGPPIDWIVLLNSKVIEVEPLYPRPGTIDDLNARIKQLVRKPGSPPESDAAKRKRLAMYNLPITLLEGEEREFKLHIRHIREIIYYEDLMIQRIDRLLDEKQVRQAYELLVALDDRQADWPGIASRRDRLLSVEAREQFEAQHVEQALALLEALHERNAGYPGLDDQFGAVVGRLVESALAQDDPRQARYFLKRLARQIPGHKLLATWTNRLTQQTRDLLAQATAAEREKRGEAALDLAEQAARTWPELPDVLPVFNRLAQRCQRLRVGVVDQIADEGRLRSVVPGPAEKRRRQLTETPLFQPGRVVDKIARYETRFFQEWDPADLGHSVVFRLQAFHSAGQSQPMVTGAGLTESLADRLDPSSRDFDARLAAAVAGVNVRGPFELAVRFRQVPLRPEALFAFPCRRASIPAPGAAGLQDDSAASAAGLSPTFPFEKVETQGGEQTLYRRRVSEPEQAADRHVAEVIEVRYGSHEKAIQAMLRGNVSLLPAVPASAIKAFESRSEFFTQPYGLPTTHFLQFHPNSRALRSRALRRALIYAIDRQRMLEELFLHAPAGNLGRLVTAPWPSTIYAYNRFIAPHAFDPILAVSLAKTAEKELGDKLPRLRLWIADDPEAQQAAARIVEGWRRIGVEAVLSVPQPGRPSPTIDSPDWDVAYRSEVVAEPLVELWPLLALTSSTETATLSYLPTWLRHDLLELDRVGDWRSAELLLHKLHRQLSAEVHLIPLWELDTHFVVRRNVRNIPERPLSPYQGVEHWKVEPWFSRD